MIEIEPGEYGNIAFLALVGIPLTVIIWAGTMWAVGRIYVDIREYFRGHK